MRTPGQVLLFWDYDTQWGADRSRMPGGPKTWGALEFEHTERLLELHAQYEVPACFAVVGSASLPGERPYHDPAQIRRIHAAGHEIASHSHRHDWLPGLNRQALRATLANSKDALEQCIGAPVSAFVPPYNQPVDYLPALSVSLSERREAGRERTDLSALCGMLAETGYRFCRVMYRPLTVRIREWMGRGDAYRWQQPARIQGVTCLRLNSRCGFTEPTREAVRQCSCQGGWLVIYGHPHSLSAGNSQDERHLVPLLAMLRDLARQGAIRLSLPRDVVAAQG